MQNFILKLLQSYQRQEGAASIIIRRAMFNCAVWQDMLEVGRVSAPTPDTFLSWNRAHFGAWCITSSPLILYELGSAQLLHCGFRLFLLNF